MPFLLDVHFQCLFLLYLLSLFEAIPLLLITNKGKPKKNLYDLI